jgi:DNA replication protein DnaC
VPDITSRFLDDEAYARLRREHPHIKGGYHDYCPTCFKNNGPGQPGTYVWLGETVECDCERQLALHKWYLASGIGLTYQRLNWTDFHAEPGSEQDQILLKVGNYTERSQVYFSRGIGLFFTGGFGSGKTMLANLALKHFVKEGRSCWATTFANAVEMFTAGWKSREDQDYFQRKFFSSEVVLLDDLGKEGRNKSGMAEKLFDNILRERAQLGRPTFVTSNLEVADIERDYGPAADSLMTEKSVPINFPDQDYRSKASTRELDEIKRGETRPIT